MAKTDKKSALKTGKEKKLSKLKKAIKKLKLFEKKLKAKEKKIDSKLNKTRCKNCKKDKPKESKEKFTDLLKKEKKDSKKNKEKRNKEKKSEAKNGEKKKSRKQKSSKSKKQKETDLKDSIPQEAEAKKEKPETGKSDAPVFKEMTSVSTDLNTKEAIAFLRKLEGVNEVESFVKKDKRSTVQKAATSRIHAIKG